MEELIAATIASLILTVLMAAFGYIQNWLKKQGYDQGDFAYNATIFTSGAIASVVAKYSPALSTQIQVKAQELVAAWNNKDADTSQVATLTAELNALVKEAETVISTGTSADTAEAA